MPFLERLPRYNGMAMPIFCKKYVRGTKDIKKREFIGLHHHDYCEIVYCVGGICTALIGNKKYKIKEGELLLIHSHEPHDVGTTESEAEYYVLRFLPDVIITTEMRVSEYSYLMLITNSDKKYQSHFPSFEFPIGMIETLMQKIANECNEKKLGYETIMRSDTISILFYIIRKWNEKHPELLESEISKENEIVLKKAIEYIEENYADVDEKKCADHVFVSTAHLSRLFKRGVKTTFNAFVNEIKLKEAQRLLSSEKMSVTDVANQVGYTDVSYFIKIFKNKYNMTPAKYRKLKIN